MTKQAQTWVVIQAGVHPAYLGKFYNEDVTAERIIIYPKALVHLRASVKYHKPHPSVWGCPPYVKCANASLHFLSFRSLPLQPLSYAHRTQQPGTSRVLYVKAGFTERG